MRPTVFIAVAGIASALLSASSGIITSARADEVHLVGGTVINGKATRQNDKVLVEMESGEITLQADTVERIVSADTDVQRYEKSLAKLSKNDVKGFLALADFCRDHDMHEREQRLLQHVIDIDSDNKDARARLGYVRGDSGWMKRADQMRAQGLIEKDGQWVTRAEALELERLHAQADAAAHERDKVQVELETKRVELATRQAELQAKRNEDTRTASQMQAQPAPAVGYVGYSPYYYSPVVPYIVTPYRRHGQTPPYATPDYNRPRPRQDTFPINGVRDPWDSIRNPRGYF